VTNFSHFLTPVRVILGIFCHSSFAWISTFKSTSLAAAAHLSHSESASILAVFRGFEKVFTISP